jgi:metal-dependent amidase/aminoacylase/carboxypeptidase family protein
VNALNAANLAYMATHMLRQEARRDANLVISGIITEGGMASNIIPDRAVCNFGVRSSDEAYLEEMVEKVARCAEGAAMVTGAEVKVTKSKGYSSKKQNPPLIEVLWGNYASQGIEIRHWKETYRGMPLASSDFGDTSHVVPVASSNIKIGAPGLPGHSIQMADATMTPEGQEAMIVGAKALGMTLVELLADPERLRSVKEYFNDH